MSYRRRLIISCSALLACAPPAGAMAVPDPSGPAPVPTATLADAGPEHGRPDGESAPAGAAADASVGELFREFRRLYEARRYDEAQPLAERIILQVEASASLADQLPTALNNLGAVQLEQGDHAGAEVAFTRSLELLERSQGVGSRRMISPLIGLGRARAAQGQHARAIEVLQRALSISRRADGLFNLAQLEIIDQLATSQIVLEDYVSADQLRSYSLQIVEQRYGVDDPRTLPVVNKLAAWYELTHRFVAARVLYLRTFRIASQTAAGRNATAIAALRGIARTHRLQFVLDPDSTATGPRTPTMDGRDPGRWPELTVFDPPSLGMPVTARLNGEGEQALRRALKTVEESPGVPAVLRAWLHMDLGDWYLTARRPDDALRNYRIAWPLLPPSVLDANQNPLLRPRLLAYRAPESALRRRDLPRDETVQKSVEFAFTVTARGEVRDITTVSSEVGRTQESVVREALQRAIYSPRFENGEPVDTPDVRMRESFHEPVKKADESAAAAVPAGPPAASTPAQTAPAAASEASPQPVPPETAVPPQP